MHVVLVSRCEKRALRKTRAILDSYALRSGDHTWLTPITKEGLAELHTMLRRAATRQTSVACFRNDGRARMTLLWTVGSRKHFDQHGISPVATRKKPQRAEQPAWASQAALLAAAGGYTHDLGKFGEAFQTKLRATKPEADPVRHEWLSFLALRNILAGHIDWPNTGTAWPALWGSLTNAIQDGNMAPFDRPLQCASDVLLYLVATHHKLPAKDGATIGNKVFVRKDNHVPTPVAYPTVQSRALIRRALSRIEAMPANPDPLYWRGVAIYARMALILADHAQSAVKQGYEDVAAYANTVRLEDGRRCLNQSLDWHLQAVGHHAGEMVFKMRALRPPALSQDAIERLSTRAMGRFAWQERMAGALAASHSAASVPHLVLNLAATGSGKTRANVRAVCALNEDREVRFATALNLRTLTLQTRDAYQEQLQIGRDEMACVIGDKLSVLLHEYQKTLSVSVNETLVDEDENGPEDAVQAVSDFDYLDAPVWLSGFLARDKDLASVIGAPVLVSTIDFLVAAGEPQRQGKHALAALRLMTSDLIIDEIDGYDPKALLAVLRLVMMAALFGRHVIASSATLSKPVASLIWQAYAHGAKMRGALDGRPGDFRTALVDDHMAPKVWNPGDLEAFQKDYLAHVATMAEKLNEAGSPRRLAYLQRLRTQTVEGFHEAMLTAVNRLHRDHSWPDDKTQKQISLGLVRMANIGPAIEAAEYLAKKLPATARVACYHARHFAIQRFHIERRLDSLLTRKNGDNCNDHIMADPEIRKMLDDPHCKELILIVVATPVEEVGRDHDFDWGVLEPSSAQAIVQPGGRVNRHRLADLGGKPNIAILQYNRKQVDQTAKGECGPVFTEPGLEITIDASTKTTHGSHDLEQLFKWDCKGELVIDARLRFDSNNHDFPKYDDTATKMDTDRLFSQLISENGKPEWTALETYSRAPLREKRANEVQATLTLTDRPGLSPYRFDVADYVFGSSSYRSVTQDGGVLPNAWLSLTDDEARALSQEVNVPVDAAMTVSLELRRNKGKLNFDAVRRHAHFGFFREPAKR